MGRAIPTPGNLRVTRRLDPLDGSRHSSAQQSEEFDDRLITQSNPLRVRPELDTFWKGDDKQRPGGKAHGNPVRKEGTSDRCYQPIGKMGARRHPETQSRRPGLARGDPPQTPPSINQTCPKTLWPLCHHKRNIPSRIPDQIADLVGDP